MIIDEISPRNKCCTELVPVAASELVNTVELVFEVNRFSDSGGTDIQYIVDKHKFKLFHSAAQNLE